MNFERTKEIWLDFMQKKCQSLFNFYSFPCLSSLFIVYLHKTQISWVRRPEILFLHLWNISFCLPGQIKASLVMLTRVWWGKVKGKKWTHWHSDSGSKSPTMHWSELYREQSVVIMVCREGRVDHNDHDFFLFLHGHSKTWPNNFNRIQARSTVADGLVKTHPP